MNNVTPENVTMVVQGATPVQIVTLFFLGVIALGVVIAIVKWVVDLKVSSLPEDIKALKDGMHKMQIKLIELEGKLWRHDEIKNEIKCALQEHELKYHRSDNIITKGENQ